MAGSALAFILVYWALAFGLRTAIQLRRTGSTGFKGVSGRPGSAEWLGGVLFAVAVACGVAAPVLALTGVLLPVALLDTEIVAAAGAGIFAGGLATTLWAQYAMGDAWRIGVDESEQTELITRGPFSVVRNPIFTGMILAGLGLTLMVPNVVAIAGLGLLLVAIELQVRYVEEPYLRRTHGEAFARYAGRVGRFLPGIGYVGH